MSVAHDGEWMRRFRRALLSWYARHKRSLPWRESKDPYAIWVSEIMLQQTQVATVLDYYARFLKRFPNVRSLALADEQSVLALWAGLGYYRRARQLHAAAKVIHEDFGGEFPRRFEEVLSLPGIGRYTAGAITSFAYDDRQPVLEANTIRLFSRLIALREDPTSTASQNRLWEFATEILPARSGCGELNQAVMELGSLVCTPRRPECSQCPAQSFCPTHHQGLHDEIPKPKIKAAPIEQTHGLVLVERRGRYLMRRNEPGGWWEGLWDFPRTKLDERGMKIGSVGRHKPLAMECQSRIQAQLANDLGLDCQLQRWVKTMRHGVTKYRIRLLCFEAEVHSEFRLKQCPGHWKWVTPEDVAELPLTSTAQKLQRWLADQPRTAARP